MVGARVSESEKQALRKMAEKFGVFETDVVRAAVRIFLREAMRMSDDELNVIIWRLGTTPEEVKDEGD